MVRLWEHRMVIIKGHKVDRSLLFETLKALLWRPQGPIEGPERGGSDCLAH